jgi:hypothetical protein
MQSKILSFFLVVFLFAGCSKDNPTGSSQLSDSELKSKLIGTWSDGFLTMQFDADNNYQQVLNLKDSIKDNQTEFLNGTYTIKDGILSNNLTEWKIVDTSSYPNGTEHLLPNYKILIQDNQLYLYPVNILNNSTGSGNEIWGEWITTEWNVKYYPPAISPAVLGQLEQIYKFNKDSMTVTYGLKYSDGSSNPVYFQTSTLSYNFPNLSWDLNYHKIIEFHNGQIYMFEKLNEPPNPLLKIK